MVEYIGATRKDVERASQAGKFRFSFRRSSGALEKALYEVRGGGTKVLSPTLANRIIDRWWKSPPGTKVVVGWIHSDALLNRNENANKFRIVTAVVTRPRSTMTHEIGYNRATNKFIKGPMSPRQNFYEILMTEIGQSDHRIRYIDEEWMASAMSPVFTGNNGSRYGLSYFFVWPAGIINNNKLSDFTNKVQNIVQKRLYNRKKRNFHKFLRSNKTEAEAAIEKLRLIRQRLEKKEAPRKKRLEKNRRKQSQVRRVVAAPTKKKK